MKKILICMVFVININLFGTPAQVIIIRHGEKPKDHSDVNLNQKGKERAAALVPYFVGRPEVTQFGLPEAIFAQSPKDENSSERPVQTVTPLSNLINVAIDSDYTHSEFPEMIEAIMNNSNFDDKMVLICWEHTVINEIAAKFGLSKPKAYPDSAFDQTWIISFDSHGKPHLKIWQQMLMFGDSK